MPAAPLPGSFRSLEQPLPETARREHYSLTAVPLAARGVSGDKYPPQGPQPCQELLGDELPDARVKFRRRDPSSHLSHDDEDGIGQCPASSHRARTTTGMCMLWQTSLEGSMGRCGKKGKKRDTEFCE